jgi:Ca2+-binding RTX toxin-like protein
MTSFTVKSAADLSDLGTTISLGDESDNFSLGYVPALKAVSIDGGDGTDVLDLSAMTVAASLRGDISGGVGVVLNNVAQSIVNFEAVIGTAFNDNISVTGAQKVLSGAGADNVTGSDGNDEIDLGAGKDRAALKGGDDVVHFTVDATDNISKVSGDLTLDFSQYSAGALNVSFSRNNWTQAGYALLAEATPSKIDVTWVGTDLGDTVKGLGHVLGFEVSAGLGDDTVWGGNGDDSISTGDGNDVVYTSLGNDKIDFGDDTGADTLNIRDGYTGKEKIAVDLDAGTVKTWALVADFTTGLDAKYTTTLTGHADVINVSRALDLHGSSSGETVNLLAGVSTVDMGGGDDTVVTRIAGQIVHGGDGNDTFDGVGGDKVGVVGLTSTFYGDVGDDTFNLRNDNAFGGDGDDTFNGTGTIDGGAGNNLFAGGAQVLKYDSADSGDLVGIVYNGSATDHDYLILDGRVFDRGDSTASGVQSNISGTVETYTWDHSVKAGSITHVNGGESYSDTLGGSVSKVYGTAGKDIFIGDGVAAMYGQGGDDYFHLYGTNNGVGAAARLAYGGDGNDWFEIQSGFKGNVYGDAGSDLISIEGGGATVAAFGGDGSDAFYFFSDGTKSSVTVRDFQSGSDILVLDHDFGHSFKDLIAHRTFVSSTSMSFRGDDGSVLTVVGHLTDHDVDWRL